MAAGKLYLVPPKPVSEPVERVFLCVCCQTDVKVLQTSDGLGTILGSDISWSLKLPLP